MQKLIDLSRSKLTKIVKIDAIKSEACWNLGVLFHVCHWILTDDSSSRK
jgi:hypothetical protein